MSLDSYAFAVPKGTDLDTVKEMYQNNEVEILHHWDNNDYLHSAMERIYEIYRFGEYKQGEYTADFSEVFLKLHELDLKNLITYYHMMHYDENALKRDLEFFEFGQILAKQCLDIYYVSSI